MLVKEQIKINEIEQLLNRGNVSKVLNHIRESGGACDKINKILLKKYRLERDQGVPLENITARTVLILANENLIRFIFKKYIEYDEDLYSVAKIGLIKAIDNFCLDKGAFTTYAVKVMLNEVYSVNRLTKNVIERRRTVLFFDDIAKEVFINSNGQNEVNVQDVIADDYDFRSDVDEEDYIRYIISLFKYLTPIEQKALMYYVGLNGLPQLTQQEISQLIGRKRSTTSFILRKAIDKLNKLLAGEDCSKMEVYEIIDVESLKKQEFMV